MRTILTVENPTINLEIVIDPFIHEQAKLSRTEFLNRISYVRAIRTKESKISFYLNDTKNLSCFESLHKIVNTGNFKGQTVSVDNLFVIGLPRKLFHWLKNITVATLHKQLLHWHAAYYAFNTFPEFADEALNPLILAEVKQILKQFYPDNYKTEFNLTDIDDDDEYKAKREKALKHYYAVSERYTGSLPPEFLKNPYREPSSNIKDNDYDWGLFPDWQFSILTSYFNVYDWLTIVERSKEKLQEFHRESLEKKLITMKEIDAIFESGVADTMQRAESDSELWQKWKFTFQNYETRKEFTYSIVPREETKVGFVYLNQDETGATKIGWTTKAGTERISGIQTGNPTKVTERGRFNASNPKTEKVLHKFFEEKKAREGGEWFWLTEEDIKNILDPHWRMSNNIF
jgi:hypothetical protein